MSTTVNVTEADIRAGLVGDCYNCAVALAVQRATGERESRIVEIDYKTKLIVGPFYLDAPWEVARFVWEFDSLDHDEDGHPILPDDLAGAVLAPFFFELPDHGSPEWEESCYGCEQLFAPDELDGEGYCEECLRKWEEVANG